MTQLKDYLTNGEAISMTKYNVFASAHYVVNDYTFSSCFTDMIDKEGGDFQSVLNWYVKKLLSERSTNLDAIVALGIRNRKLDDGFMHRDWCEVPIENPDYKARTFTIKAYDHKRTCIMTRINAKNVIEAISLFYHYYDIHPTPGEYPERFISFEILEQNWRLY